MLTRAIYKERQAWRALPIVAAAMLFGALLLASGIALAVHDTGAFELDGNAVSGNAAPPSGPADDWDRVCHQEVGVDCSATVAGGNQDTSGATAVAWSADCLVGNSGVDCNNLNATIFTGGGSKDPGDINGWAWKDGAGGLPDKDNLLHGFAARYSLPGTNAAGNCPNGTDILPNGTVDPTKYNPAVNCDVVFFGSDRYDNSGDAQQGFWFFQDKIGLGSNAVGGGTGFTGLHKNGDLLVISDFSNGGTTSIITVYKWDTTCTKGASKPNPGDCGDVNLRLLSTSSNAKCAATLGGNDNACGIVNAANGTVAPWPYLDKSGNSTYLQGELYEGGINLSTLGLSAECFSSIGSETRSSTSTTATLKDFVLGGFGACNATIATTPKGDTALSGVNGTATVSDDAKVNVTGTNPPAPTGSVKFYLCGPSTTALIGCDATGTLKSTINLSTATKSGNNYTINSGNVTLNASGYYCWFATWPGDSHYSPSPDAAFTDGSATECFSIAQPTSVLTTLHETDANGVDVTPTANNGTTITINAGGHVVDYATVSPSGATGSVVFRYYTDSTTCLADDGTGGSDGGSGSVTGGSAHGSVVTPTSGTYYFRAFFTGTGLNNNSSSDCSEVLTVRQPTSVTTTLHETDINGVDITPTANNGTSITINAGSYVVDYAHLTPNTATGNVVFRYYTDSTVCLADNGTGGVSAGSGAVSGGDAHGTPVNPGTGTYYFRAFYTATSGSLYNSSSSDCSEVLTVRQPTSVLTTLHETDANGVDVTPTANNGTTITINAGGHVVDYATVSPSGATGSVVFRYYTDSTVCANDTGSGGVSAGSGSVSGGSAHGTVVSPTTGTYYFRAFYTATGLYNSSSSDCSEVLTVRQFNPSLITAQTVTVTDSMTITAAGGGNLAGTAHFQPFTSSDCTTGSLHAQDDVSVSGASPQTVASTVTVTFTGAGPHVVYWKVSYTSNNPAQASIGSTCAESTSMTITNQ